MNRWKPCHCVAECYCLLILMCFYPCFSSYGAKWSAGFWFWLLWHHQNLFGSMCLILGGSGVSFAGYLVLWWMLQGSRIIMIILNTSVSVNLKLEFCGQKDDQICKKLQVTVPHLYIPSVCHHICHQRLLQTKFLVNFSCPPDILILSVHYFLIL